MHMWVGCLTDELTNSAFPAILRSIFSRRKNIPEPASRSSTKFVLKSLCVSKSASNILEAWPGIPIFVSGARISY